MYEMYPETWPAMGDRRPQQDEGKRPRRRPRRQHNVLPAALAAGRIAAHRPSDG